MTNLTMDNIEHLVLRHDERLTSQHSTIHEIKEVVEGLVEASRNQSHAVDQLLKKAENDKGLEARLISLEKSFDRAQFISKIIYTIVTTPSLIVIGYYAFGFLQAHSK